MLTKTVFLLLVGLATVALCATTLSQPRRSTRRRPTQTSEVPSNTIKAEMAHCQPEKKTVKLDLPQEAGTMFFPTCVRVEQCGGCCGHSMLTCRPIRTETVTYEVTKMIGENISSPYYVNVTKHVECEEQCSVTEKECTASQIYDKKNCECICENEEQKRACHKSQDKLWDKRLLHLQMPQRRRQVQHRAVILPGILHVCESEIVTDPGVPEGHCTAPDASTDALHGPAADKTVLCIHDMVAYEPTIYFYLFLFILYSSIRKEERGG
ncbi:hypothetical protein O3P69_008921 [Scylla paramamosain]|uniref:Platelet-derived growth factor (PDGF) family profile domain-containing protein n=1 Tax=Scylla paramamosain TaxID=85552 RepID=A0AAW0TPW3_SCYPA